MGAGGGVPNVPIMSAKTGKMLQWLLLIGYCDGIGLAINTSSRSQSMISFCLIGVPFFAIVVLAVGLAWADGDSSSWPEDEYEDFHKDL
jgi:hypothetical protein